MKIKDLTKDKNRKTEDDSNTMSALQRLKSIDKKGSRPSQKTTNIDNFSKKDDKIVENHFREDEMEASASTSTDNYYREKYYEEKISSIHTCIANEIGKLDSKFKDYLDKQWKWIIGIVLAICIPLISIIINYNNQINDKIEKQTKELLDSCERENKNYTIHRIDSLLEKKLKIPE